MLAATLPATLAVPSMPEDEYGVVVDLLKPEELEEESGDTLAADSGSSEELDSAEDVPLQAHPETLQNGIRHVDSLANFVKHCQQQHATEGAPASALVPPDAVEEEVTHRVQFNSNGPVVHRIPSVSSSEFGKVWLTTADFDRQEKEVKMTCFRWENHLRGEIPFDESNNSIRGLEHLYRETRDREGKHIPSSKRVHRNAVMDEVRRQRKENDGKLIDAEQIREVSLSASQTDRQKCLALGSADRDAAVKAWETSSKTSEPQTFRPKEKKTRKGFRFWKKK